MRWAVDWKKFKKHEQKLWTEKMRWNMNNKVWTEGKEMKHEQWSEDWGKWNLTMSATK